MSRHLSKENDQLVKEVEMIQDTIDISAKARRKQAKIRRKPWGMGLLNL